jgi:hypothetical protein
MIDYPIVQKTAHAPRAALDRPLPAFYMEDFSVLGIQVSDCARAIQVLAQHAYALKPSKSSPAVRLATASHLPEVIRLLTQSGLSCEIADIAQEMYQG